MSRLIPLVIVLAACGSKQSEPQGACIVEFSELGDNGVACTVDTQSACKAATALPQIRSGGLAELKMKRFEAGKSCADVGFKVAGCRDVAIAWSFERTCP